MKFYTDASCCKLRPLNLFNSFSSTLKALAQLSPSSYCLEPALIFMMALKYHRKWCLSFHQNKELYS